MRNYCTQPTANCGSAVYLHHIVAIRMTFSTLTSGRNFRSSRVAGSSGAIVLSWTSAGLCVCVFFCGGRWRWAAGHMQRTPVGLCFSLPHRAKRQLEGLITWDSHQQAGTEGALFEGILANLHYTTDMFCGVAGQGPPDACSDHQRSWLRWLHPCICVFEGFNVS